LTIYVSLTTQNRRSPYEIEIPALTFVEKTSIANVQGLASLPIVRLERKIGTLPDSVMQDIKKALS
jgi:mRNA interferase MazF